MRLTIFNWRGREGGGEGNLSGAIEESISAAGGGSEERPFMGKGLEARGDREDSPKLSPKLEALKAKNKARSAASRAAGAGVQAPSPPPMSDSPVPVGRKTRANSAGAGAGPARAASDAGALPLLPTPSPPSPSWKTPCQVRAAGSDRLVNAGTMRAHRAAPGVARRTHVRCDDAHRRPEREHSDGA